MTLHSSFFRLVTILGLCARLFTQSPSSPSADTRNSEGANAKPQVPVKAPYDSPIDGTATITPDQAKDLLDGKWYFNLHTAANPGGEIRGQVIKGN